MPSEKNSRKEFTQFYWILNYHYKN